MNNHVGNNSVKSYKNLMKTSIIKNNTCVENKTNPILTIKGDRRVKLDRSNKDKNESVISFSHSVQDINVLKKLPQSPQISSQKLYANRSTRDVKITTSKSSANFTKNEMTRVYSLTPFHKVDPEFYNESQNHFWNKELQRVNTEKLLIFRPNSSRKYLTQNHSTFGKSDIFPPKLNLKDPNKSSNENSQSFSLSHSVSESRIRDYHTTDRVLNSSDSQRQALYNCYFKFGNQTNVQSSQSAPNVSKSTSNKYNGVKTVTIDFKPIKSIKPMHLKLYESTLQKANIPETHPSYNKVDDTYKAPATTSFKKKIDFFKTSYNFLKNYY